MTPRLEVRAIDRYSPPDYPGRSIEPAGLVGHRYGGSVLDAMRRGLTRPLVVFGLFASLSLPAAGDDEKPGVRAAQEPEPKKDDPNVRVLSREEIASLVGDLSRLEIETGEGIDGDIAGQMGFITEEEGRAVLAAMFAKNGFALERDVRVRGAGLDFQVDGFDGGRRAGFEFLGPRQQGAWNFEPLETDLSPEEMSELELERARGERAILVLDGRNYGYNVFAMEHLPSKSRAVDRLVEDVRRFLVWLAEERR